MNRRDFLKRIAAAGLVAAAPEILVPERKFWQLDRTMAPPARNGDDSPYVQWFIDHGKQLPPDRYVLYRTLEVNEKGALLFTSSRFEGHTNGAPMLKANRPLEYGRDSMYANVFDGQGYSGGIRFHVDDGDEGQPVVRDLSALRIGGGEPAFMIELPA